MSIKRMAALWLVLMASAAGCYEDGAVRHSSVPTSSSESAESLRSDVERLEKQLHLVSSKAICSGDIRLMIKALEMECFGKDYCKDEEVRSIVQEIDPRQRFLWIMRDMPHATVFLRSDASEPIGKRRLRLLRYLIAPPWLRFARIWVVAHSSASEPAEKQAAFDRAAIVKNQLAELTFETENGKTYQFNKEHIHALNYNFPLREPSTKSRRAPGDIDQIDRLNRLNRNVIPPEDLPIDDEPIDIFKGVWVFLVDC